MKIPTTIIIGTNQYAVRVCARVVWTNKDISGQITYGTKKIKLKHQVDERELEGTFFHEVAHGILRELEFNHPRIVSFRNNEQFVQELGLVLRKTFSDLMEKQ